MSKTPSPTPRTSSRREELRRQQEAAARATQRTNRLVKVAWATGIGVIVLLLAVMVWSLMRPGSSGGSATGTLVPPAGATSDGAVVLGDPAAKVTVSVYADYMCPYCGQFERANGTDLAAAVSSGTAKIEFHPMSFLDDHSSGTKFSTRAANAFVTLANADPGVALAFNGLLYENQPEEGSSGLTDARIVELAKQAGATEAMTSAFASQTYVPWVEEATKKAFDSGITGTPTVKINGQVFSGDLYTAGPLAAAIGQAAGA